MMDDINVMISYLCGAQDQTQSLLIGMPVLSLSVPHAMNSFYGNFRVHTQNDKIKTGFPGT